MFRRNTFATDFPSSPRRMSLKKNSLLSADIRFLRAARALFLRRFPKREGYQFFLRTTQSRGIGKEFYAGRTLGKKENARGLYGDIIDRQGRLATISMGSGDLATVKIAIRSFDDAAFDAVPKVYSIKKVSQKSFPKKTTLPTKIIDTEYRSILTLCKRRMAQESTVRGVKFKLEHLSVGVEVGSAAYTASIGGECQQDFPVHFSVGGEIMAQWKNKKDGAYFSFTSQTPDRDGVLREINDTLTEAALAVRKPNTPYERVQGRVRFDAKLFMELLDEFEDHLSLRWAKEGMSLALDKKVQQIADFSPLLTVDLVAADGTAFDRHLTDKGHLIENKPLLRTGKIVFPVANEDELDKYHWPKNKACVGQPVTRVVPGNSDIRDDETDFILVNLNALHNLNSQTLEVNLTGSGFVIKNGKRRFSSNLVLKCSLLDIFKNIQKIGSTVRRQHDWSCPDVLVQLDNH